jgi:DNA polymerase III sliding clamp (beta) subunit (PCNA family)
MAVKIPKSLKAVAGFASQEIVRYSLTGVRVSKKGEQIRVSASDGKRLEGVRPSREDYREGILCLSRSDEGLE